MSNSENTSTGLTSKPDGIYFKGTYLQYRITGLTTFNLDRLKVTLKEDDPEANMPINVVLLIQYVKCFKFHWFEYFVCILD